MKKQNPSFTILDKESICAPLGFLASGIHAGVRQNQTKLDLTIIYSEVPATAAGVFTTNAIKAAPVILTKKNLALKGKLQAIIVNSGNANACTGKKGMQDAEKMVSDTAKALNLSNKMIGVCSTGVIGLPLPMKKIEAGIPKVAKALNSKNGHQAALAIMTTDTYPKEIAISIELGDKTVRLGGIAKGSGMIHPNMATLLGFITSDVAISPEALQKGLKQCTQNTFNMISVDGDCSTNDTVLMLANGKAKNDYIDSAKHPLWKPFCQALDFVCMSLAKHVVRDGEGATKLIEIQVHGAVSVAQARKAARTISTSPLVKTAIYGNDANWGRIACAAGYSGVELNPEKVSVELASLCLFKNGLPLAFDEEQASALLREKDILIKVGLGVGKASATAWGCDLTYDYVKINASYRS